MRALRLVGAMVVVGCGGGGDGGTPPPPAVASVVITPSGAQSTTLCGELNFSAQALSATQQQLSRTITWSSSSQANVVVAGSGSSSTATGVGVGSSTITATADGVTSNPGVTVTVGAGGQAPTSATVTAGSTANTFSPGCVRIAAGGTVTWTFGALEHNVDFSGTGAPADIPNRTNTSEQRTFPTSGNFTYICTLHAGMNGRVIVQ